MEMDSGQYRLILVLTIKSSPGAEHNYVYVSKHCHWLKADFGRSACLCFMCMLFPCYVCVLFACYFRCARSFNYVSWVMIYPGKRKDTCTCTICRQHAPSPGFALKFNHTVKTSWKFNNIFFLILMKECAGGLFLVMPDLFSGIPWTLSAICECHFTQTDLFLAT